METRVEQKVFTLKEANAAIMKLSDSFSHIFSLNERIKTIARDMKELMDIWDEQILEPDNPDNKFYFEKMRTREQVIEELQENVAGMQKSGAIIKDVNGGLVDFYFRYGEDLVFLCWKYGEEKIKYWHPVQGGYAGRRPIEELAQLE